MSDRNLMGVPMKNLMAEVVGTMLLVYFGVGSVVTATGSAAYVHHKGKDDETSYLVLGFNGQGQPQGTSTLHVSFAFGLAVASIAQAIGHISGAHLNPAVSFGLVAAGRFPLPSAIAYTISQFIGATVGAAFLKFTTSRVVQMKDGDTFYAGSSYNPERDFKDWHLGASLLGPGMGLLTGIITEAILTFLLVFTVCGATDSSRDDVKGSVPLAIGLTVGICHITGIAYTGSSVNPARSFGPALFSPEDNVWDDLIVYMVGPTLGGILAGIVYSTFFDGDKKSR